MTYETFEKAEFLYSKIGAKKRFKNTLVDIKESKNKEIYLELFSYDKMRFGRDAFRTLYPEQFDKISKEVDEYLESVLEKILQVVDDDILTLLKEFDEI